MQNTQHNRPSLNSTKQHNKTSSGDDKLRGAICGAIDSLETGSDTGTYTVDNDGDELAKGEKVEYPLREPNIVEDNNGLKNQKLEDDSEWVSEWASKTTSMEVKDGNHTRH